MRALAARARLLDAHPRADAVLAAIFAVLNVAAVLVTGPDRPVPAALAGAAVALPIAWRRRRPLPALCVFAAGLLAARLALGDDLPPNPIAFVAVLLTFAAGTRLPPHTGLPAVLALVVTLQLGEGFEDFPNLEIGFVTLGPWWAAREVRARRVLLAARVARERELEAAEDAFTELSVRRERARIAADLHDVVSHHVAVMVIQAGAGRLATTAGPADAAARLVTIAEAGRQALDEMARLVDVLGTGVHDPTAAIPALLEQARAAGVDVRLLGAEEAAGLSPADGALVYRVVQEGLTNALKHAPGSRVDVTLRHEDGELRVEVADEGRTAAAAPLTASGSGFGLVGMRARVDAVGGRLEAGADPAGGWRLAAWLPLRTPIAAGDAGS